MFWIVPPGAVVRAAAVAGHGQAAGRPGVFSTMPFVPPVAEMRWNVSRCADGGARDVQGGAGAPWSADRVRPGDRHVPLFVAVNVALVPFRVTPPLKLNVEPPVLLSSRMPVPLA